MAVFASPSPQPLLKRGEAGRSDSYGCCRMEPRRGTSMWSINEPKPPSGSIRHRTRTRCFRNH